MPRIAFTVLELVLIAGIVVLGGAMLHKQMTGDDPGQIVQTTANGPLLSEGTEAQSKPYDAYQSIARRDLFKTPKDGAAPQAAIDIETLKPTELKLKLWGTITGEDGLTRAVIEDQTKKEQAFFRAGEEVASATIKMILREKVVLSVKGEDQVLEIEHPAGLDGPKPAAWISPSVSPGVAPPPAAPLTPVARSIRMKLSRLGPISDNPQDWSQDATVSPHVSDEGENGLMINRITPSSPLRRLGIRNGDIVAGINGQPVSELGDIFETLLEMAEGQSLSLSFKRRGREQQIDFIFE